MNGFGDHGLDDGAFGDKKGNIVQAFDAFSKSKPQYVQTTASGGKWTVAMIIVSVLLVFSEFSRWWTGHEEHNFAVEKGVGHDLQINMDIVVKMRCPDLHINIQDASGDRILAGEMLKKDLTNWEQWVDKNGIHQLGKDIHGRVVTGEGWHAGLGHDEGFGEEHVHDIVSGAMGRKAKWGKTPKIKGKPRDGDSCRVYGSLDVNKVQGDFHITARGHGYQELDVPGHLDHTTFNFSHIVSELSFGPFYPNLLNPLDRTLAGTPNHFHKFQYFLSVVPTIYTVSTGVSSNIYNPSRTIVTNQYAVTEQSMIIGERQIPGIFFKYDIEPMLLSVNERRDGFLYFVVKLVNVLSGVLVTGHWCFTLTEWAGEVWGRRRRRGGSDGGVLTGRAHEKD